MGQPKDNISAGLDALLGGSRPSESQTAQNPDVGASTSDTADSPP